MSITSNANQVLAWLSGKQKRAQKASVSAAAAGAKVLYEHARAVAPEKEGTLKRAIYRTLSKDASTDTQTTYHVGWNSKKAPHGHLIEFGTSRAPARPFLGKALADKGPEAAKALKSTFKKRMEADD